MTLTRTPIASGAESIIYINSEDQIEKDRIPKPYRIPEIDRSLRTSRTKREAKILQKLTMLKIPVPKLLSVKSDCIVMENIEGIQLKKILDTEPFLAKRIGEHLARMHDHHIIHGDLTTSNMILNHSTSTPELYFIDFGLSFISARIEDKAVDIHLFKQALESKHFTVDKEAYRFFLEGYHLKDRDEILQRLEEVETRGRYKEKFS
ncbi:MAG: KEOPS complex kinase/ATPase Bud32 [Candidatus Woesearchaeota archaeon]